MHSSSLNFKQINVRRTSYYSILLSTDISQFPSLQFIQNMKQLKMYVIDIGCYSTPQGADVLYVEIDTLIKDPLQQLQKAVKAKIDHIQDQELGYIKSIQKEQRAYMLEVSRKDGRVINENYLLPFLKEFGSVLMISWISQDQVLVKYESLGSATSCMDGAKVDGDYFAAFKGSKDASSKTISIQQPFKVNLFHSLQGSKNWPQKPKPLVASNPVFIPKADNDQIISKVASWGINGLQSSQSSEGLDGSILGIGGMKNDILSPDESMIEKDEQLYHSSDEEKLFDDLEK